MAEVKCWDCGSNIIDHAIRPFKCVNCGSTDLMISTGAPGPFATKDELEQMVVNQRETIVALKAANADLLAACKALLGSGFDAGDGFIDIEHDGSDDAEHMEVINHTKAAIAKAEPSSLATTVLSEREQNAKDDATWKTIVDHVSAGGTLFPVTPNE